MEAAVVIRGNTTVFDDMGWGTNTQAEWLALIRALELAQSEHLSAIELIGDSREVIGAANAILSGSMAGHPHADTLLRLTETARPARIRWIKREQNLAGIALLRRHPR